MHTSALHKTAYNRAKTARVGAFAPVGGALASFIGETSWATVKENKWEKAVVLLAESL